MEMAEAPGAARRLELPTSCSLLLRLRTHDREAWWEFVSLYAPLVVRWCHRRGLAEPDIADVSQEVFAKVARGLPQFRKEERDGSLCGWLCRITHHEIAQFFRERDQLASGQGGTEAHLRLQQQTDVRSERLSGEDAIELRHATGYLYQKAVETVRAEFSDATWLMFWRTVVGGNQASEVAAELGTTAANVRQAKCRVLRRLKEVVGDIPN